MKKIIVAASFACALSIAGGASAADAVKIDNLLRSELQVVTGAEVIVSVVELGAGISLPKHYHPGEEFVYLLEGSAIVWQEGKPDVTLHAGEIYRIPLKQVHTAITGDSSAKAIVFRVHETGAPDRIAVE